MKNLSKISGKIKRLNDIVTVKFLVGTTGLAVCVGFALHTNGSVTHCWAVGTALAALR